MTPIEDTLNTLKDIRLPEDARLRMRGELLAYASLHAIPAASVRSPFYTFSSRLYAGFAIVLLFVVSLGGTAYASGSAVPGDTLYPVKVGLTEPLQTILVPSDRGKAAWHAILAERRLEETAELAARGTLSSTTQVALAASFDSEVSASQESASNLEHKGDTNGSLSVQSDLEARLNAHAHILSVISAHYASATTTEAERTHQSLEAMLAVITERQDDVVSARLALEDSIAPNHGTDVALATAAKVAVVAKQPSPARNRYAASPTVQIQMAADIRSEEEQHILERHIPFLAKFLPVSTTTSATSTATTTVSTATSTPAVPSEDDDDGDTENIKK